GKSENKSALFGSSSVLPDYKLCLALCADEVASWRALCAVGACPHCARRWWSEYGSNHHVFRGRRRCGLVMLNAISIDLEDWFCVHNLSGAIRREDWDTCELRVRDSTRRLIELFDRHNTRATFFVLGWVAERIPEVIRELEDRGHEIAAHGYNHLLLTEISPEEFDQDLARALEAISGCGIKSRPLGFRAPSFTMVKATKEWALPI